MKRYTTIFLALTLSGCSFIEDRSAEQVEIVDISDGSRTYTSGKSVQSDTIQYTVRSGDTLGSIAKKMLGNAQRYLEIAELNNIEPQAPIYVGQQLKLPSKGLILVKPRSSQQTVAKTEQATQSEEQPTTEMDNLLSEQRYYEAIEYARAQENLADNNELQEKLIIAAQNQVRQMRREGLTGEAEGLLQVLIDDGRLSESSQQILLSNLAALNVEQDLAEAKQLADDEKFDESYNILLSAWQVSGTELESNALFTGTRNKVSEHYHQKALRLYRNQKLDESLMYWDRILAINPSDDLALVYKDRVKSLKEKLESL
ncbi:LysM domain-containing protein [Kangiella sp.]|uniref:LysM peptidoglycan-binding domain-containing protein n=1 Tax=Kangiella sp. TaxID=1920245 RepID=UPI0019AFA28B|nr:LysM domain-containing protein [Kangiella sp.]MBD3653080.1 LysM peptidoglycan-binding domain-containing protein [Kangiella sp.]